LLEDFETGLEGWGSYDDGAGSNLTCVADSSTAYSGNNALRIEYSLVANGWVGCERYYETPQDWSTSDGIRFNLYSQQGGLGGSLIITVGEGDQTAPFEAFYEAGDSENWQQVYFSWQDFQRPDWAEESGPQTFDPASIVGFDFAFSAGEEAIQNVIWVDDLGLGETEAQPETSEQLETEEEVAEEEETAQGEGGIRGLIGRLFPNCPLSLALPLVVLPLALRRKVRRRGMERR
jgi:hypothetical protein